MKAWEVVGYAGEGEILCTDCGDDDKHTAIFASQIEDVAGGCCGGCGDVWDDDWGGWQTPATTGLEHMHMSMLYGGG